MDIAILGTGRVGTALGVAFAQAGHTVVYGSREPGRDDVAALVERTAGAARATSPREAVADGEVVVLATPWEATEALVRALDLGGKTVLDTTNPVSFPDLGHIAEPSGGELVQRWAPGAHVVKAFCTVGAGVMANARFGDARAALWIAGDDASAKARATALAEVVGFEALDAGGIERSRALEETAILWIAHAGQAGRGFAFGVLRR